MNLKLKFWSIMKKIWAFIQHQKSSTSGWALGMIMQWEHPILIESKRQKSLEKELNKIKQNTYTFKNNCFIQRKYNHLYNAITIIFVFCLFPFQEDIGLETDEEYNAVMPNWSWDSYTWKLTSYIALNKSSLGCLTILSLKKYCSAWNVHMHRSVVSLMISNFACMLTLKSVQYLMSYVNFRNGML